MAKRKLPTKTERQVNRKSNLKRLAAELKRRGVAFENTDLRKPLSKYGERRARELAGIVFGTEQIIKLPSEAAKRAVKEAFPDDVTGSGKGYVRVKVSSPDEIATIRDVGLSIATPLRTGVTIERITVPGGARLDNVLRFLQSDSAASAKAKREFFAFRFEDYASPRIFTDAQSLYDFLLEYDKSEDDEGPGPRVYLYRIYPPGDWYDLVRRETLDKKAELEGATLGKRGAELRRIRFARQRIDAKLSKIPSASRPSKSERMEAYKQRERERNRNRQRRTEKRRDQMREYMRKRRAKEKGET